MYMYLHTHTHTHMMHEHLLYMYTCSVRGTAVHVPLYQCQIIIAYAGPAHFATNPQLRDFSALEQYRGLRYGFLNSFMRLFALDTRVLSFRCLFPALRKACATLHEGVYVSCVFKPYLLNPSTSVHGVSSYWHGFSSDYPCTLCFCFHNPVHDDCCSFQALNPKFHSPLTRQALN